MAVNTYPFHLVVDSQKLTNEDKWLEAKMTALLKEYIPGLSIVGIQRMRDGGFLLLYVGHRESFVTVRGYTQGLVTVNIEHYKKHEEDNLIRCTQYTSMLDEMAEALGSEQYQRLCPIKSGTVQTYFRTTDNRICDLAIDTVLFEEKSPYQLVQVSRSALPLGNILILDGMPNPATKDVFYTLMQQGKEKYQDKEIVILGGGDGTLLWELLKQKPKFVLMLELDEVVIRACRTHMRDANGGVLDNLKGQNYEIVIGDCVPHLKTLLKEGRKFDYVFGDLTDTTYDKENTGSPTSDRISASKINQYRSFLKDVMNLSFKILKLSGKYMCHSTGTARSDYLKAFEDTLRELDEPVNISTEVTFVPYFVEFRRCYQIWRSS